MKIYLDNCVYNRPYDKLEELTVDLEAQAKLRIQYWIRDGKYELVTSEILMMEVNDCPIDIRKTGISEFIIENSSIHVGSNNNEKINEMALQIMKTGVKYKDACHIASAIIADCEYFISTDKRLLKYKTDSLKLVTPIEFISEMEDEFYE